jgi:hypothetical protein
MPLFLQPPAASALRCHAALHAATAQALSPPCEASREAMRTASRFYRGHRIRAVQLDSTWHATVHGRTGALVKYIEATTLANALAQAEWFIETRFAFRPPSRYERVAVWGVHPYAHASATERTARPCYVLGMAELHHVVVLAQRLAEGRRQHPATPPSGGG